MAGKILTVAICAYNMEKYIGQALDSCIIKDMDKIEILIMNDGSTDNTAAISQAYCDKYPESFKLINKENGGWGSNLNEAIKLATGKYFRELDADDWFDTDNLQKFIELLENIDVDLVTSVYQNCYEDKDELPNLPWRKCAGKEYVLNDMEEAVLFSIWSVTIHTNLLKKYHRPLPKHTLYTDSLFVLQILPYVEKVYLSDYIVYNYRLGRPGQSVELESLKKHYKEYIQVMDLELEFYKEICPKKNQKHIMLRLKSKYEAMMITLIKLYKETDLDMKRFIIEYENKIQKELPELYDITGKRRMMSWIRKSHYTILFIVKKWIGKRFY